VVLFMRRNPRKPVLIKHPYVCRSLQVA